LDLTGVREERVPLIEREEEREDVVLVWVRKGGS
jgi:hypothetical protein